MGDRCGKSTPPTNALRAALQALVSGSAIPPAPAGRVLARRVGFGFHPRRHSASPIRPPELPPNLRADHVPPFYGGSPFLKVFTSGLLAALRSTLTNGFPPRRGF